MRNVCINIVIPNNKVRRVEGNYTGFHKHFHKHNCNLPAARLTLNLRSAAWEVTSFNRLLYKLNIAKTTSQILRVIEGKFKNPFNKSVSNVRPDNSRPASETKQIERQRCNCVIFRLDIQRLNMNVPVSCRDVKDKVHTEI